MHAEHPGACDMHTKDPGVRDRHAPVHTQRTPAGTRDVHVQAHAPPPPTQPACLRSPDAPGAGRGRGPEPRAGGRGPRPPALRAGRAARAAALPRPGARRLPHATTQPLVLRGHHLPQGTTVIPLLTSAHFEEGVWETPEDFNPGHFLDEKGAFRKREEAMPFSIGKRACPGEDLARLELLLFTTTLLQSLELELAGPPDAIDLRALRRAFRGSSLAFQLRARPRPRPL
ncbi:cytochrome P450 2S1-like isoform X2 [Alligator sinensis]|uniref:Cytochrome P450 2S1-like isoform X2 n=1 Tax=Alligator sinensis TaxID=38654 RepID=A0A3Q0FSP0_ALLSI|nr:cytochrome P450 2S1-like isoform X2 [Alligator sinensis]